VKWAAVAAVKEIFRTQRKKVQFFLDLHGHSAATGAMINARAKADRPEIGRFFAIACEAYEGFSMHRMTCDYTWGQGSASDVAFLDFGIEMSFTVEASFGSLVPPLLANVRGWRKLGRSLAKSVLAFLEGRGRDIVAPSPARKISLPRVASTRANRRLGPPLPALRPIGRILKAPERLRGVKAQASRQNH
jgi:hypothetical protein